MRLGSIPALAILAGVASVASACADPPPSGTPSLRVERVGAMSVARAAHQATLLPAGTVLITGGCSGHHCDRVLATTEIYDPATRSFREAAPMLTPRASHAAVALADGRVLVCGGWTGGSATASAEIYDPKSGRWSKAGDMTEPRASPIAVRLRDGRVLVVGGGEGGLGDLATAEVFDPSTSRFTAVGPMRTNHYLATALPDGRVLVTGGKSADGEILRSAEIFDPASATFRSTGSMTVPRVKHAAAPLPDGRVLVLGGSDGRSYAGRTASTEIYDPRTGTFAPGPSMLHRRHKIRDAVAVLPSGAVLVAGGARRPEVFDPVRGIFEPVAGELSAPPMFATATVLGTGDALLVGGYGATTEPAASAWLIRAAARR